MLINRRAIVALALTISAVAGAPQLLHAQGTITLAAGQTPSTLVLPSAKLTVPIIVDMSLAAGSNLASLASGVTWGASLLSLDSIRPAGFGSLTSNFASGNASLALFNTTGTTATVTVANLYFSTTAATGGTQVQLNPSAAGNDLGASLFGQLRTRSLDVCVAPIGSWGDGNGDGVVNIIDAQQIARFSVSLPVANATAITAEGDVNADGTVNIIDAQQIARFSVGLSAAARIATPLALAPPVANVSVSPSTPNVGIGQSAQLTAMPQDASETALTGCASVTWSSSNPAIATVNSSGVVTAVALGSATVTATSNNGKSGGSAITTFVPVVSIVVAPDTATVPMGTQVQLTATTRDAGNNVLTGQTITYTSSDTSIATVSSSGLVTTWTVGSVFVTTASGGKTFSSGLRVTPLATNSLALGDNHACVLDVTGAAYCWGSNLSGQLGDGTTTSSGVPVQVAVPAGLTFTQITAGGNGSSCAVSTQQGLYCWGSIAGGSGNNLTPVLVNSPLRAQSASTISGITCSLNPAGAAFCAGTNRSGELGTGDTLSSLVPRAVSGGLTFRSISVGLFGPCGLQVGGAAYCWGSNSFATLGIAAQPTNSLLPAPVSGGLVFTSLSAGAILNCGVVSGGTGYCWGTSEFGAGGTGGTANVTQVAPTAIVSPVTFMSVVPGTGNDIYDSICGLSTDGTAYCWGNNFSGQVGSSATLPGSCPFLTSTFPCTGVPTAVTTTSKFSVIAVGAEQACGITTTHTLLCWGRNSAGQLGDNTTTNRSTPVTVLGGLRIP